MSRVNLHLLELEEISESVLELVGLAVEAIEGLFQRRWPSNRLELLK
jgi:hypothetical protein